MNSHIKFPSPASPSPGGFPGLPLLRWVHEQWGVWAWTETHPCAVSPKPGPAPHPTPPACPATGHGSQQPDYSGEEPDGKNETLCPLDFQQAGEIVDNDLNRYLINPIPQVRLTGSRAGAWSAEASMRFQQQDRQGWASCPVSSTHQQSAALHLPTPQLARPLPFCPGREAACHRGCVPLGVCDGPALLCHELQRRAPMEERVPVATSRPQGAIGFKLDTCWQG